MSQQEWQSFISRLESKECEKVHKTFWRQGGWANLTDSQMNQYYIKESDLFATATRHLETCLNRLPKK